MTAGAALDATTKAALAIANRTKDRTIAGYKRAAENAKREQENFYRRLGGGMGTLAGTLTSAGLRSYKGGSGVNVSNVPVEVLAGPIFFALGMSGIAGDWSDAISQYGAGMTSFPLGLYLYGGMVKAQEDKAKKAQ